MPRTIKTSPATASKKRKPEPFILAEPGDDDTTINDVMAAYKLFKYHRSMKSERVTITEPTNMEMYFMIHELLNIEKITLPSFIAECDKEGIRIPPRAEMMALQDLAHSRFTEPA